MTNKAIEKLKEAIKRNGYKSDSFLSLQPSQKIDINNTSARPPEPKQENTPGKKL